MNRIAEDILEEMNITNDGLDIALGADEPKEELIFKEEVDSTPFTIVSTDERKTYFAVMGRYRITESTYTNLADFKSELKGFDWNRLVQIVLVLLESTGNMVNVNVKDNEN